MSAAPALLCAGLEVALNRYLQLEPAALEDCAALSSDAIALHFSGLEWQLSLEFDTRGVRVLGDSAKAPSVSLSGTPAAFAQLALRNARGETTLPPELTLEGDAQVLQRFRRLLGRVGFDLEEWIAPLIGGAAAHRSSQSLLGLFNWGRKSADTLSLNTAEYLREETRDLARAADVADWMDEVDTLRERADRFEARLRRLEAKTGAAR